MQEWSLIHNQSMLKSIYKTPPIISYRGGKSLKDILARAKLWRHKWQCRNRKDTCGSQSRSVMIFSPIAICVAIIIAWIVSATQTACRWCAARVQTRRSSNLLFIRTCLAFTSLTKLNFESLWLSSSLQFRGLGKVTATWEEWVPPCLHRMILHTWSPLLLSAILSIWRSRILYLCFYWKIALIKNSILIYRNT